MSILLKFLLKLLYYLPESVVLATASLTYVGIKPAKKKLCIFALLFGTMTFLIRDVLLRGSSPNGLHSLILLLVNAILLKCVFDLTYLLSILCDLLFFITIFTFEILSNGLLVLLGFPLAQFLEAHQYYNFLGLFPLTLISLFVYILQKNGFTLVPINKVIEMIKQ